MPEDNLEQILEAFEQVKGTFHLPQTLSNEHDDVTVKYWHSMLKLAEDEAQKESIVTSFCERFEADQEQMQDLLGNKHNWVDYNLYHAFSTHCQQQLGMNTETFWKETAEKTFLDYSDKQIAVGRFFPLNFIIKQMSGQFKNWSKVNKIKVEKLDRSKNSYRIKRKTLEETQKRTEQFIGKEALDILLRRDCIFTHYSFTTTFQKLFNQPKLFLETGQSEADNNEWSEYFVHPSSPHRFKIVEKYYSLLASLRNFGRGHRSSIKKENEEFRQIIFELNQTVSDRTQEISRQNATISRKNEELQSRQDLIAKLYENISKLRFSSDKHAIRNYLNAQFESEKNTIINQIASQLHLVYALSENNQDWQEYLINASSPFGIQKEDFSKISSLEEKLFQINIDQEEEKKDDIMEEEDSDGFGDLYDDFFSDEIHLDQAYSEFKSKQEQFKEANKNVLSELDIFQPFYSLRTIQEVISYINEKISSVGEIGFDELPLSDALEIAQKKAEKEKKAEIKLNLQLDYNPLFTTDKDTLVNVLAELFYNCVDAQATEVTIYSINPNTIKEDDLPLLNEITGFNTFPQHYLRIVDNGTGIPAEHAEKLNRYLTTGDIDPSTLSTKGKTTDKGGLGTRNLDNFLLLHKGQCRYKRREDQSGTEVHIYLERTKI